MTHRNIKIKKGFSLILASFFMLSASQMTAATNCEATALYSFDQVTDWYGGISNSVGDNYDVGKHLTDELFRITPDGLEPGVVSQIEVDEKTKIASLQVNPNCRWSDGRPISSADIKAGLLTILNPKSSDAFPISGIVTNGEKVKNGEMATEALGITTPDATTVQFPTELGTEALKIQLTDALVLPIPSWLMAEDPDYPFRTEPPEVFSGPYMVDNFDAEAMAIELKANPYYCGIQADFSHLTLQGRSTSEDFIQSAAQENDIIVFFPEAGYDAASRLLSLDWIGNNYTLESTTRSHIAFYRFNARQGPLAELEIRQAVLMGIDWQGQAGLYSRINRDSNEYEASLSLVPFDYLPDAPQFIRDLRPREERLQEAREILGAFGYDDDNPLRLKAALAEYQSYYFFPMKEMIEAGLPVEISDTVFQNESEYYEKVYIAPETGYDISLAEWGTPTPSLTFYLNFYLNNNTTPASVTSAGEGYIETIQHSSDKAEVQQAAFDTLELLYDEALFVPVFETGFPYLIPKTVERRKRIDAPLALDLERKDKSDCNS